MGTENSYKGINTYGRGSVVKIDTKKAKNILIDTDPQKRWEMFRNIIVGDLQDIIENFESIEWELEI